MPLDELAPACTPGSRPASTASTTPGCGSSRQTLPPFPWYMGGQLYCNLFVGAADTAEFATRYGRRLCLDVSHTKLAANLPRAAVLRGGRPARPAQPTTCTSSTPSASTARASRSATARSTGRCSPASSTVLAPGVGFIPEIWQGHVNNGEGFWLALERLEQWF